MGAPKENSIVQASGWQKDRERRLNERFQLNNPLTESHDKIKSAQKNSAPIPSIKAAKTTCTSRKPKQLSLWNRLFGPTYYKRGELENGTMAELVANRWKVMTDYQTGNAELESPILKKGTTLTFWSEPSDDIVHLHKAGRYYVVKSEDLYNENIFKPLPILAENYGYDFKIVKRQWDPKIKVGTKLTLIERTGKGWYVTVMTGARIKHTIKVQNWNANCKNLKYLELKEGEKVRIIDQNDESRGKVVGVLCTRTGNFHDLARESLIRVPTNGKVNWEPERRMFHRDFNDYGQLKRGHGWLVDRDEFVDSFFQIYS